MERAKFKCRHCNKEMKDMISQGDHTCVKVKVKWQAPRTHKYKKKLIWQ